MWEFIMEVNIWAVLLGLFLAYIADCMYQANKTIKKEEEDSKK